MHDAAAAIPLTHINRVDRYAVWELLAQRVGLLFLAGKSRALENADGHTAGGGIPQGLVKGEAGAGAHRLQLRVRKALLVVAGGIRNKCPVHCGEVNAGLGGSGEANEYVLGILHTGSTAQIFETQVRGGIFGPGDRRPPRSQV
jgi:hypothetical protein